MNFALCFVVAGLSRRAVRVSATAPAAQVARWMLFRWRTPPGRSDWLVEPFPSAWRRLTVVDLLPKASRKSNGKLAASNSAYARAGTASSISTAFMRVMEKGLKPLCGGRGKSRGSEKGIQSPSPYWLTPWQKVSAWNAGFAMCFQSLTSSRIFARRRGRSFPDHTWIPLWRAGRLLRRRWCSGRGR